MDITKIKEQRHSLLAGLEQEFLDELIPAKLSPETEEQTEMLTMILEDLSGEGTETVCDFFFLPVFGDEVDIQVFTCMFTVIDEVEDDRFGELVSTVSMMNAYLPVGCFAYDAGVNSIIFRHSYEMPLDLTDDELASNVNLCINMAVEMVSAYGYMVHEVNERERTPESVRKAMVAPLK